MRERERGKDGKRERRKEGKRERGREKRGKGKEKRNVPSGRSLLRRASTSEVLVGYRG